MLRALLRFWRHLSDRRRALGALFALGLASAGISLATPLLGKAFVDAVGGGGDFAAVPRIALALVALALLDLAFAAWSGRVHARLSADILAKLRAELFSRCMHAPLSKVEALRHGDLLTRFGTDMPRIQTLLVDGLLGSVQNALFLVVAAIITFSLSPTLALWSFAGALLALMATMAFRHSIEGRTRRVREAVADLSHFLAERLGALRAIRLHRTGREEAVRLDSASERLKSEVVGFQLLDAVATGTPGLLLTLALAWIYIVGGRLLESGAITLGTFVAFVLYQGRLFAPAQGLLGVVRHVQEARVSLERVCEILGPDDHQTTESAGAGERGTPGEAIEMRDVAFAYEGKAPVFRAATLVVASGERVGLFGASGEGKSTLVQLLFGLRRPLAGSVRIFGRTAHLAGDTGAGALLGYAGTEPFLLHASVEENLRYGNPGASRQALERAVALAEADGFIAALPDGFSTIIGGRGQVLSDGQRQRIGLARLFLRNPPVLVLDEAMSCLDLETEVRIRRSLWDAFPDRTVLVISHRPVGLDDFDRILFLHEGRFAAVSAEEIRARLASSQYRFEATYNQAVIGSAGG